MSQAQKLKFSTISSFPWPATAYAQRAGARANFDSFYSAHKWIDPNWLGWFIGFTEGLYYSISNIKFNAALLYNISNCLFPSGPYVLNLKKSRLLPHSCEVDKGFNDKKKLSILLIKAQSKTSVNYNMSLTLWGSNLQYNLGFSKFSKTVSNLVVLPPYQYSVIVGLLLSDAWLSIRQEGWNARLGLELTSKSFEVMWKTFLILAHYCSSLPGYRSRIRTINLLQSYVIQTRALPCFTPWVGTPKPQATSAGAKGWTI